MTQKCPVLVTGGAGYIGSHAVLALTDAGWPVAVIDNLVTGFRWAVPEGVPFYQGDIEDADLLARIIAEQNIGAVMHFAGSVVVPESVSDPLKYYHNNTAKSRALLEAAHVEQPGRVDLPAVDVGDPGHRHEDPAAPRHLDDQADDARPGAGE